MGWLQYTYTVDGPKAAERALTLARSMHWASAFSVEVAARIIPSARLRRKRLQLGEVTRELGRISACSGVLEQSDDWAYWSDAVALLATLCDERLRERSSALAQDLRVREVIAHLRSPKELDLLNPHRGDLGG